MGVEAFVVVVGLEGWGGGPESQRGKHRAQPRGALETVGLERARGTGKARCSGEVQRYRVERRLRGQRTGAGLTLRHERVGIEQN